METNTAEPTEDSSHTQTDREEGAVESETIPEYEAAREAIVAALSGTVNGCMKEMGYFPGMPQLLQDTRHEIAVLRDQNVKLHSDNVSLSRIINTQKEQIASLSVRTPGERDKEIAGLRRQLGHVVAERDDIARTYQHIKMSYDQCRRDLAQLTAFTQSRLPGRIEIVRQGPPTPGMPPPQTQAMFQDGMPVMPPFAVPSHRHPSNGAPSIPFNPALGGTAPIVYPIPFPSQPLHPSQIRFVSSPTIDSSMSRMNLSGATISPVSPHQPSPPGSASQLSGPSASASAGPSRKSSIRKASEASTDIIDLTMEDDIGPRKKRRVEDGNVTMARAPSDIPEQKPAVIEQPTITNGDQGTASEDDADDTDTGDGLDADGRRSEEECLSIAFEKDADGKMWCTMCKLRFNRNLTQNVPQAFTSDNTRELVDHCELEHPAGWKTLRGIPA